MLASDVKSFVQPIALAGLMNVHVNMTHNKSVTTNTPEFKL